MGLETIGEFNPEQFSQTNGFSDRNLQVIDKVSYLGEHRLGVPRYRDGNPMLKGTKYQESVEKLAREKQLSLIKPDNTPSQFATTTKHH
jgi:hypothetical protein